MITLTLTLALLATYRRSWCHMCTVQIIVSLALLANARRNLVLLVLKYATQRARTLDE